MTDDLAAWLLERIAEDEADARDSLPGPWAVTEWPSAVAHGRWVITSRHDPKFVAEFLDYGSDRRVAHHVARHNPARVLAECDAKRRIVQLHTGGHECSVYDQRDEVDACRYIDDRPCSTLLLLAQSYSAQPGFRDEWSSVQVSW